MCQIHFSWSYPQTSLHPPLQVVCPWCFPWAKPGNYAAAGDNQLNPLFILGVCQGRRWDSFPTVRQADPAHNVFARSNTRLEGKRKAQDHHAPAAHSHTGWTWAETTSLVNEIPDLLILWIGKTTRGWVEGIVLSPEFSRIEAAAERFSEYFFSWLLLWFLNLSSVKSSKTFTRKSL